MSTAMKLIWNPGCHGARGSRTQITTAARARPERVSIVLPRSRPATSEAIRTVAKAGTYGIGPVSVNVEQSASNRTVFCVQHLCTMGRDSDVIVERSVVSNNPKYKQENVNAGGTNRRARKSQIEAALYPLKGCVEATAGVSGWIVEPLVVRERVVSQVR